MLRKIVTLIALIVAAGAVPGLSAIALASTPHAAVILSAKTVVTAAGGRVPIRAAVADASGWCTWSVRPRIEGQFEKRVRCQADMDRVADLPANGSAATKSYAVQLQQNAKQKTMAQIVLKVRGRAHSRRTTPTVPTTIAPTTTTAPARTTTTLPVTTTTVPASGGNCTDPVFTSSNAEATDNTDPGNAEYYWVNNDAWDGGHGPQTIYVCNQSSWYVTSDQPNDGGAVETYPDTEYDVGSRNTPSTTPISGWPSGSITSTFSEDYPSAGGWDAAYDLWTNDWTNETMVWNQWAGSQSYWADCSQAANPESYCGKPQNAAVTIDGVGYTFLANGPSNTDCTTANEADCELMFFRDTQTSSGSVDLAAIFQWEVANGYAKASDIPTQLEYGVEISYTSGTETFPTTGLTFSLSS
jgi:hypothetical protein